MLRRSFPGAEIALLNGFYFYWESETCLIEKIVDLGKAILSDRRPTFIIAFSFGGLLAKGIVAHQDNHDVRAIVTMATEHRGHLPRIAVTRDICLGIPLDVEVPIYSFGGLFDPIVWPWTAFTDRSFHRTLATGHFSFMRSAKTRSIVMAALKDIVTRHQER